MTKATTSNNGDISNARVRMRNRLGAQAQASAMMPTTGLGAVAAPATSPTAELFYRLTALETLVERLEARNVRLEAMIEGYRTTGEWPSPPVEAAAADPGDPGEEAPADPGEPTSPDVPAPDAPAEDPATVADPAVE